MSYDPSEWLKLNCPKCQTANPEGARFCLNCGNQLEAPARVDGERKYVTVLFADVVIAFFGAPVAHEDDAERAVRAGLDIQAAAREYAEEVRRNYGVDFKV